MGVVFAGKCRFGEGVGRKGRRGRERDTRKMDAEVSLRETHTQGLGGLDGSPVRKESTLGYLIYSVGSTCMYSSGSGSGGGSSSTHTCDAFSMPVLPVIACRLSVSVVVMPWGYLVRSVVEWLKLVVTLVWAGKVTWPEPSAQVPRCPDFQISRFWGVDGMDLLVGYMQL